MGNEGRELKDADGKPITDVAGNEVKNNGQPYRQGLVFRCDLDLISPCRATSKRSPGISATNYEVTVDSFGTNVAVGQRRRRQQRRSHQLRDAVWQLRVQRRDDRQRVADEAHQHRGGDSQAPLAPKRSGVVPNMLQTGGGSPTGILINEGTALGRASPISSSTAMPARAPSAPIP